MIQFKKDFTPHQLYGSGFAAILICLLFFMFNRNDLWIYVASGLALLIMIWPLPVRYFAIVWFGIGETLGFFVSRILLTVFYVLLVIPVGLFVRKRIRNNMQLPCFKKETSSVFKSRNHLFIPDDFTKPF